MSERKCFVIAPIGHAGSPTRKRSDQILKYVITPPVEKAGYGKPIRADQMAESGIITTQIIDLVINADLVIADLTERNPNVFYELAIRHVFRKPFIQIIEEGEQIPFDVAGLRTVMIDIHDLDSVDDAKTQIAQHIEAIDKDSSNVQTPVSITIDRIQLQQSGDLEERSLSEVLLSLSELRSMVANLQTVSANQPSSIPQAIRRNEFPNVAASSGGWLSAYDSMGADGDGRVIRRGPPPSGPSNETVRIGVRVDPPSEKPQDH